MNVLVSFGSDRISFNFFLQNLSLCSRGVCIDEELRLIAYIQFYLQY